MPMPRRRPRRSGAIGGGYNRAWRNLAGIIGRLSRRLVRQYYRHMSPAPFSASLPPGSIAVMDAERPRLGSAGRMRRAVEPDCLHDLDPLEQHLALHLTAAAAGRLCEDALHHVHSRHDMPKRREAEERAARVERGVGADHDREIARRRIGIGAMRHRDGAVGVVDAGLAGRLDRHRIEDAARVHADAALDQAVGRIALAPRGAVEIGAVERAVVDIAHEIGDSLGRMARIEREHDRPRRGDQFDVDDARCGGEGRDGEQRERESHQETHGRAVADCRPRRYRVCLNPVTAHVYTSCIYGRRAMAKEYRAKVFKSGNSVALRLPKALGLKEGDEMVLREDRGKFEFEPAAGKGDRIDLTGIWGSVPGIKPLTREEREFEERELDWEGKLLKRD